MKFLEVREKNDILANLILSGGQFILKIAEILNETIFIYLVLKLLSGNAKR